MLQDTILAQAGARRDPATGAITMPIHLSAAFQHPALGQSTGFDYSRTANPTRLAFEETLATLENGERAVAFGSGLAAIDAVFRLFSSGDTVVVTEDLYGGTFRLFERFVVAQGVKFLYVDTTDLEAVKTALQSPGVKGLFVEVPTNPLLKVADISKLAALATSANALFIVDNTFLTPVLFRPLDNGADIVVYSATKYLGGHNDLIAGAAVAANAEIGERLAYIQNATGAILGPFESWLLLRSVKTLHLRMKRQQETAVEIARFLSTHPQVRSVYYPGLPSDPGHAVLSRQASGYGAIISFEVESAAFAREILSRTKVFLFAESLGGTESLVTYPIVQTHADMDASILARTGLTDRLLRLSIGLEAPADLIDDLTQALG